MNDIVIIGGGGHAESVADCIESSSNFRIAGYTDIKPSSMNYEYLGTDEELAGLFRAGIRYAACGLGYLGQGFLRDRIYNTLRTIGFILPIIFDASAVVAKNITVGEGTFIGKGAIVNANSHIGRMCIINTGAIIEHDNFIDDYVHISSGCVLCGNVRVNHHSFVGANTTVIQGISIGINSIIGASSLVLRNVEENQIRYGLISNNTHGGGGILFNFLIYFRSENYK